MGHPLPPTEISRRGLLAQGLVASVLVSLPLEQGQAAVTSPFPLTLRIDLDTPFQNVAAQNQIVRITEAIAKITGNLRVNSAVWVHVYSRHREGKQG